MRKIAVMEDFLTPEHRKRVLAAPPFGQRNFYFTGYFLKLSFRDTLRLNTR